MAKTNLKVVGVVSGSDFNNTRSEIHLNIVISNNRNFPANKG